METLSNPHRERCPFCNNNKIENGFCVSCNKQVVFENRSIPHPLVRVLKDRTRLVRYAVYVTAAVNFTLGLIEGFYDNNSAAMAINLTISLVLLYLSPRTSDYPATILIVCMLINLVNQFISPMFSLFEMHHWWIIKFLLLAIPLATVSYLLHLRRFNV